MSQSGSCSSSWVTSCASPPVAGTIQMPHAPSRLLMNAMRLPSGLQAGKPSAAGLSVTRATEPSATESV